MATRLTWFSKSSDKYLWLNTCVLWQNQKDCMTKAMEIRIDIDSLTVRVPK